MQAERYEFMKKEELINLIPALSEEDAEKIVALYQEKVTETKAQHEGAIAELLNKFAKEETDRLISEELEKANPKSVEVLRALLDESLISVEDGNLSGLSEQIEKLRKEYAFIFANDEEKPKFTKHTKSDEEETDISKLSYKERLKLYREMPELYNRLVK